MTNRPSAPVGDATSTTARAPLPAPELSVRAAEPLLAEGVRALGGAPPLGPAAISLLAAAPSLLAAEPALGARGPASARSGAPRSSSTLTSAPATGSPAPSTTDPVSRTP